MQQVPEEQLFLFDCGPDMQEIRLAADDMKRATRSRETLRAYKYDWQLFARWCESTGRQALPASAETLALFTAAHLKSRKVSSAERRMAAVIFRHRAEGMAVPDRAEARAILSGARRQRQEQPDSKAALTPRDVRAICAKLQRGKSAWECRDRALLTLGFASGLRRSNLVALNLADVRWVPRRGVAITVRSSKTDQAGKGQVIGIFRGLRKETCPVRALRAWLGRRGDEDGPLFTRIGAGDDPIIERLRGAQVNQLVHAWVKMIGLDARQYGAHSLRAGFVTAAHNAGSGTLAIMERTGHKSVEMVRRYLRNVDPFAGTDPIAKAL